ncbi:MAG: hypothetical protein AM324_014080 [Candidatus Thorarchaeota archaeon SMTZ1-83]|nr:MAG: hypothetical protein AM324_15205 [Candidatus Thorarchaeota archaeon SMTZ1-83]
MAFDIGELTEKLKEIETFAKKVSETKKIADDLAANLANMKSAINKTINDSFTEIATQIDTLRKNMEQMESVQTTAPVAPEAAPTPEAAPAPAAEAAPAAEPVFEPAPEPAAELAAEAAAEAPAEGSDQLDFLLQQKDRLKASLTDLRFDYMRGYIPEDDYKTKEAELDSQLEEVDRQIAGMK